LLRQGNTKGRDEQERDEQERPLHGKTPQDQG